MAKYVASCSGGKDSVAMVLKLIETKAPLDYIVFYDSGVEFQAVYTVIGQLMALTPVTAEFVVLHPETNFLSEFKTKKVNKRNGAQQIGMGWCGGRCRWATAKKVDTIKAFLKTLGDDIIQYIGIAADERERMKDDPRILYPLVEWGMTELECLRYCFDNGIHWYEPSFAVASGQVELYDILDRVSCWCCANKNIKELRHIHDFLPHYWHRLEELDKVSPFPFHGYYNGVPITIAYYHARFELDDAQLSFFE